MVIRRRDEKVVCAIMRKIAKEMWREGIGTQFQPEEQQAEQDRADVELPYQRHA